VDAPNLTVPSEEQEERALVALARGREDSAEPAFKLLYERLRDEVFSFLVRLVRDDALAEDLLQETFLRVYRGLDRHHPERSFRAWVFQIARNAALDSLRGKKKDQRIAEESARRASEPRSDLVPEVARREDEAGARAALEALPVEVRALLVQRHGLGMTLEELAQSHACTDRTILTRLRAAVTLLARNILAGRAPEGGRS
jgi:RNA polymerase sigma-70 factor (ECF subfamily)